MGRRRLGLGRDRNASGYKPKKGKTAPGRSWSDVDEEGFAADKR